YCHRLCCFFPSPRVLRHLPCFPTRRSSDLVFTAMPAANMLAALGARLAGAPKGTVVISHHSPADTHNRLINAADGVTGSLGPVGDRKSTRLNSSHVKSSYAVFCLKKKKH